MRQSASPAPGIEAVPETLHVNFEPLSLVPHASLSVVDELEGDYHVHGTNHGKPVYRKPGTPLAPDEDGEADGEVFIYFWDDIDEIDTDGEGTWWFGRTVGGDTVWAWGPSESEVPPAKGWYLAGGDEGSLELQITYPKTSPRQAAPSDPARSQRSRSPPRTQPRTTLVLPPAAPPRPSRSPQLPRSPRSRSLSSVEEQCRPHENGVSRRSANLRCCTKAVMRDIGRAQKSEKEKGLTHGQASASTSKEAPKQPTSGRRIVLSGLKLDDEAFRRRSLEEEGFRRRGGSLDCIDVSQNRLTDEGVNILATLLLENQQPARRLKLFNNKLKDPSSLCDLIEDAKIGAGTSNGLSELHLSHNAVCQAALVKILESLRLRADACGGLDPPFWLRLEWNKDLEGCRGLIKTEQAKGLRVCLDGATTGSGCCIQRCRHNADVHLNMHLESPRAGRPSASAAQRRPELSPRSRSPRRLTPDGRGIGARVPVITGSAQLVPRAQSVHPLHSPGRPPGARDGRASLSAHSHSPRSERSSSRASPGRRVVLGGKACAASAEEHLHSPSPPRTRPASLPSLQRQSPDRSLSGGTEPPLRRRPASPMPPDPADRVRQSVSGRLVLADRRLDDAGMLKWCKVQGRKELEKFGKGSLDSVDASKNSLTDDGVASLLDFLVDMRKGTIRLKLFNNNLKEPAAVCRLIEDKNLGVGNECGLHELHLSHNSIGVSGLEMLLDSVFRRARDCGGLRPPVWLRVERNRGLSESAREIADAYARRGLRVCLDGGTPNSGCNLKTCRHSADVHLHVEGANSNTQAGGRPQGREKKHWNSVRSWSSDDRWRSEDMWCRKGRWNS